MCNTRQLTLQLTFSCCDIVTIYDIVIATVLSGIYRFQMDYEYWKIGREQKIESCELLFRKLNKELSTVFPQWSVWHFLKRFYNEGASRSGEFKNLNKGGRRLWMYWAFLRFVQRIRRTEYRKCIAVCAKDQVNGIPQVQQGRRGHTRSRAACSRGECHAEYLSEATRRPLVV